MCFSKGDFWIFHGGFGPQEDFHRLPRSHALISGRIMPQTEQRGPDSAPKLYMFVFFMPSAPDGMPAGACWQPKKSRFEYVKPFVLVSCLLGLFGSENVTFCIFKHFVPDVVPAGAFRARDVDGGERLQESRIIPA